jgi:putative FmdB family regulatory protein
MPTYEYECRRCEHTFEAFQNMTDKPLRTCPECGGRVRRLIGAGSGVIFKGSGFHATDYRSKSYSEGAKAEAAAPASKPAGKPGSACPAKARGRGGGKGAGCRGGSCGAS